jgi:hypothetical protein
MNRIWKDFRTNLMYWRFRNITRNRMRLQSWWRARRQPAPERAARSYRPPGGAAWVYRRSSRSSWIALLVMVALLTAISVLAGRGYLNPSLGYALSTLVVVGALYWALRQV